ncbi:MAG: FtsQ-type POTRA domain-containing protein [Bacteroidetes bacterium]|nr:FtsQ-type POTRA domain-containing protein [Bacteroidota bacterium]
MRKRAFKWKRFFGILFTAAIGTVGFSGWYWLNQVRLTEVQIQGLINASEQEVKDLIRVDTGAVMFDLDPQILEDRIRRHPWIMEAHVSRLPTGLLDIRVLERYPVAQALESNGKIGFYYDRNGFRMPLTDVMWYEVPILSGDIEAYHPIIPVTDEVVKELLFELPNMSEATDAVLSEIIRVETGFEMRTTPVGNHGSIPVLIGDSDFEAKFKSLDTFWQQEVLKHEDIEYATIDLRFAGQIVTKQGRRRLVTDIRNQ